MLAALVGRDGVGEEVGEGVHTPSDLDRRSMASDLDRRVVTNSLLAMVGGVNGLLERGGTGDRAVEGIRDWGMVAVDLLLSVPSR